ncbi:hypothetical protein [Vibrio aestuarianus]|uniref:Uncharacterized protein n=1 Tax=Vibrio aestuarianus TaxID=28171 RepID=A0ABD7YN69_9VIBR|nr:hypothetical protein [Vibrio aestuarianus]WGK85888.1 hypothetical protein PYE67_03425 [Vibrio aestuarianus]CAH8189810.1 hypothetical protein VAEU17_190064 [Vibrio aestuarianus]
MSKLATESTILTIDRLRLAMGLPCINGFPTQKRANKIKAALELAYKTRTANDIRVARELLTQK